MRLAFVKFRRANDERKKNATFNTFSRPLFYGLRSDRIERAEPLYEKFEILDLIKMSKLETVKIIQKYLQKRLPANFDGCFNKAINTQNRCTLFAKSSNVRIPLFKTKRTQQSIKYIGVKIWFSIRDITRDLHYTKFKKECKNYS